MSQINLNARIKPVQYVSENIAKIPILLTGSNGANQIELLVKKTNKGWSIIEKGEIV